MLLIKQCLGVRISNFRDCFSGWILITVNLIRIGHFNHVDLILTHNGVTGFRAEHFSIDHLATLFMHENTIMTQNIFILFSAHLFH